MASTEVGAAAVEEGQVAAERQVDDCRTPVGGGPDALHDVADRTRTVGIEDADGQDRGVRCHADGNRAVSAVDRTPRGCASDVGTVPLRVARLRMPGEVELGQDPATEGGMGRVHAGVDHGDDDPGGGVRPADSTDVPQHASGRRRRERRRTAPPPPTRRRCATRPVIGANRASLHRARSRTAPPRRALPCRRARPSHRPRRGRPRPPRLPARSATALDPDVDPEYPDLDGVDLAGDD